MDSGRRRWRKVLKRVGWKRMPCWIAVSFVAALSGCTSSPTEERDFLLDFYLEGADAHEPFSQCVRDSIETGEISIQSWLAWVVASGGSDAFVTEASALLGADSAVVESVRDLPNLDQRLLTLMAGLGSFGGTTDALDDSRMRVRRMYSIVFASSQLAKASDGICAPSEELARWMESARGTGLQNQ